MSNMLDYKGYHAKIEYSAEDELFVGEVFGIRDTLAFSGTSVDELKESFKTAIDEYLDWCKDLGVEPDKEFKGSFNVRVSPELHRQAAIQASKQGISLNQFVINAIENYSNSSSITEVKNYILPVRYTTTYIEDQFNMYAFNNITRILSSRTDYKI